MSDSGVGNEGGVSAAAGAVEDGLEMQLLPRNRASPEREEGGDVLVDVGDSEERSSVGASGNDEVEDRLIRNGVNDEVINKRSGFVGADKDNNGLRTYMRSDSDVRLQS